MQFRYSVAKFKQESLIFRFSTHDMQTGALEYALHHPGGVSQSSVLQLALSEDFMWSSEPQIVRFQTK